ncbi:MAG: helix-turn-helix domain-containing protein [Desulfobacterales bacterium]|nr:helix-turn-helix domain-containing protein [Desulfobacterales bacterium]
MYTVNEAAEVLKLHPKTVRRKIKDGSIEAVRVGGQYRISQQEMDSILGDAYKEEQVRKQNRSAIVSSIVDIEGVGKNDGIRMSNTITAALNTAKMNVNVNCVYYEALGRLKVVVTSGIESAPEVLLMVRGLLKT